MGRPCRAPADQGPLAERLKENTPTGPIAAPLLIAQGDADPIVPAAMQGNYVKGLCDSGQPLQYLTYPGVDHVGLVADTSPFIGTLITWTQDRFGGKAAAEDGCGRR